MFWRMNNIWVDAEVVIPKPLGEVQKLLPHNQVTFFLQFNAKK